MATTDFDASRYLTDLHGKEYLEVKWRLLWLRTEHPDATIETELMKHEADLAIFRARVFISGGGDATGWGSETADDFEDFIEKAETKALGRALAALGYGTQFCEDFDFSAHASEASAVRSDGRSHRSRSHPRVVDAPVAPRPRTLKAIAGRRDAMATAAQVKAIYSIARDQEALDGEGVDERCRAAYGCVPAKLSRGQASELIDQLRRRTLNGSAPRERAVAKAT